MSDFKEVAKIRDEEIGMIYAVVTARPRRDGGNLYSFTFFREFEDDGEVKRVTWMNPRHADAILRLTPRVVSRIKELESLDLAVPSASHWP